MVFCAYCGQNFKRKEHLERHLPSHTNVKPYKCDSCQLSFARKDLLRKHHSSYHEVRDSNRQSDGERSKPRQKPIACTKCASTKAACDKKVPCSRCIDKNLPCDARFARRASKMPPIIGTSPTKKLKPQEVEVAAADLHMADGDQFLQDPINTNLMMWERETSQRMSVYPMQGLNYSTESIEILPNCEPGWLGDNWFSKGNVDIDPQIANFENVQMWGNHSMEGGKAALSVPPFPSINRDGTHTPSLPLTSPSMSSTTSRISSWKGSIDSCILEPTGALTWLDNGSIPELEIVIASEEAWPLARCNPQIFSGTCPQTALVYLQNFQASKLEDAWISINNLLQTTNDDFDQYQCTIIPLLTTTRDKIIAIAQSFLQKALRTHQSFCNKQGGAASLFTLPPSNVMENLLVSAVRSLSPYYTLFQGATLDPNKLILDNDTSTLLFLLMMAQGASTIPKARNLAAGLTETCRISLFNVIEKDVKLSADPIVLKSALLFTILGAWGGDAWHINIAMGQRGMYLSMLKHAGMLEAQASILAKVDNSTDIETAWRKWQLREHKYRLVYNWVMIDQELGLFHDIAPILSITELQTPLPEDERLWRAKNAVEWRDIYDLCANSSNSGYYSSAYPEVGLSLNHLFHDILRDELGIKNRCLPPLRLRLLLHPLQSLVYHLGLLSYLSGIYDNHRSSRPLTIASTLLRLEEVQSSLQRWYDLCMINAKETPNCNITNNSLVLWHLISLNAITCFPEIEKLIRNSAFDEPEQGSRSQRPIYQPEKVIFHCGQVLKTVAAMPKSGRPPWWSAAIYRVTIILLADSISRPRRQTEEKGPLVIVNLVTSEDSAINAYISNFYGIPALLDGNGSLIKLDSPDELLTYCITLLDKGISTRFSDGIRRKLQKVLRVYEGKQRRASTGSNV